MLNTSRTTMMAAILLGLLGTAQAHAESGDTIAFFRAEALRAVAVSEAGGRVVEPRADRHGRLRPVARQMAALSRRERSAVAVVEDAPVPAPSDGRGRIYDMVSRSAASHGIPLSLAHRIVLRESNYNCSAYNPSGATGIMQILPRTARSVGVTGSLHGCAAGLEAGMRYLGMAYRIAHGNPAYAATLYNQGLAARPRRSAYSRLVML